MTGERHFRASSRPHVACNVRLRLGGQRGATEIFCCTHDIGEGGLFAITDAVLVDGSEVHVVIEAPSLWQAVVLRAVVVWSVPSTGSERAGVGLKFVGVSERERQVLDELICALDFEA